MKDFSKSFYEWKHLLKLIFHVEFGSNEFKKSESSGPEWKHLIKLSLGSSTQPVSESSKENRRALWKWIFSSPFRRADEDPLKQRDSSGNALRDFFYFVSLFFSVNKIWTRKNIAMISGISVLAVFVVWLFLFHHLSGLRRANESLKAEISNSPKINVQHVAIQRPPVTDSPPIPSESLESQKNVAPLLKATPLEKTPSGFKAPDSREAVKSSNIESRTVEVWLRVDGGNAAELQYPASDVVRIAISKIESKILYDLQLNVSHLAVKANHRYVVQFRARSDSDRSMYAGFGRSHDAWYGLGLYNKVELTPDWHEFLEEFWATEDADNGRIFFDLGDNGIPVELAGIQLISFDSD